MKKRLKKKLEQQGRLGQRNPAAFFVGERRIIEQYLLLKELDADHALLKFGELKDGRFKSQHLNPKEAVEYLNKLVGAAIGLGALRMSAHDLD